MSDDLKPSSPYRRHRNNDLESGGSHGYKDDEDDENYGPFDIVRTKSASADRLKKWRKAALVLNASRRIRYTLDLQKVVGMEDEAQKIIDRLGVSTKSLDIVSIVGMPGLGKTTLARKVYNEFSITHRFQFRGQCCVSQVYKKKSLLLDILGGNVEDVLDKNEDELADVLYKYLKGKRYLILLDDVWDTKAWESLKLSFPDDGYGSRILLTSRSHTVVKEINSKDEPHSLRPLTFDESWELLQTKLSYEKRFPPELHDLGMDIANQCKRLPLMIVIIAGLLSNLAQHTWPEVANSLREGSLSIADQCKKTLELSYHHLPSHLKPCFRYFGAFQEDQKIHVRELLWLWIAEGFVEKTGSRSLEDVAEDYMKELIHRNLIMAAKREHSGKVKLCSLHDLLLEFSKAKCKEERFLDWSHEYELGGFTETTTSYRLRFDSRKVKDLAKAKRPCPPLHSLFFITDDKERNEQWFEILDKFCRPKGLTVLESRGTPTDTLFPRLIGSLDSVRYLALTFEARDVKIPSSIEKLSNLETFIVETNTLFVSLPDTIWNMENLKHMCTNGEDAFFKFPYENPSNLEKLETLSTVQLSCGKADKVLRKVANVRRLKCEIPKIKQCQSKTRCNKLDFEFLTKLESLSLYDWDFHEVQFQFPHQLTKLVVSGFCLPWSEISTIDKLPNLRVLKLMTGAYIGETWDMEEGETGTDEVRTFPELRYLKLSRMNLVRWKASEDNFPSLEKVVLDRCWHLEEIPLSLANVQTLEMVEVSYCEAATTSVQDMQKERMNVMGHNLPVYIYPFPSSTSGLDSEGNLQR